jgi:hypothetical protein
MVPERVCNVSVHFGSLQLKDYLHFESGALSWYHEFPLDALPHTLSRPLGISSGDYAPKLKSRIVVSVTGTQNEISSRSS